MIFTSDAIVLKRTNFANNDILLTLFTSRVGKMNAVAQGARHPKNRFASVANPFVYGKFYLLTGSGMSKINGADINKSFYSIREDILKLAYGAWLLELTDMVIVEGEQNLELFMGLKLCLSILSDMDIHDNDEKIEILKMAYEWKLLSKIGLKPLLDKCAQCSVKVDGDGYFSCEEGGMLCQDCYREIISQMDLENKKSKKPINVYKVGDTIPKILEFLFAKNVHEILDTSIHLTYVKKIDTLFIEYLKCHLGVNKFNSRAFLKSISSN